MPSSFHGHAKTNVGCRSASVSSWPRSMAPSRLSWKTIRPVYCRFSYAASQTPHTFGVFMSPPLVFSVLSLLLNCFSAGMYPHRVPSSLFVPASYCTFFVSTFVPFLCPTGGGGGAANLPAAPVQGRRVARQGQHRRSRRAGAHGGAASARGRASGGGEGTRGAEEGRAALEGGRGRARGETSRLRQGRQSAVVFKAAQGKMGVCACVPWLAEVIDTPCAHWTAAAG